MSLVDAPERHEDLFEELLAQVATYNDDVDHELLARAFDFASRAHDGQERRSGSRSSTTRSAPPRSAPS